MATTRVAPGRLGIDQAQPLPGQRNPHGAQPRDRRRCADQADAAPRAGRVGIGHVIGPQVKAADNRQPIALGRDQPRGKVQGLRQARPCRGGVRPVVDAGAEPPGIDPGAVGGAEIGAGGGLVRADRAARTPVQRIGDIEQP